MGSLILVWVYLIEYSNKKNTEVEKEIKNYKGIIIKAQKSERNWQVDLILIK